MPLSDLLGMPRARVIVHPRPLSDAEANILSARHSDSQSGCYAELILKDVFLENTLYRPRVLRIVAIFLSFEGTGSTVRRRLATTAIGKVLFPKGKLADDPEVFDAATKEAFEASVRKFAEYVQPPARAKRRK